MMSVGCWMQLHCFCIGRVKNAVKGAQLLRACMTGQLGWHASVDGQR